MSRPNGELGPGDSVIGQRRVKVAKAIVMLGGEDQVAHPSIFGDLYPFCGIELSWVEFFVQIVVLLYGHRAWWRVKSGRAARRRVTIQPISVRTRLTGPQ